MEEVVTQSVAVKTALEAVFTEQALLLIQLVTSLLPRTKCFKSPNPNAQDNDIRSQGLLVTRDSPP